jgi:putative ABC transport system permease protein
MISLAGRDLVHAWGKFVFTGAGLGLLIGVTLTMAGLYRGMVDDGKVLLDNSGADLWGVQPDTLGPYAEPSGLRDDTWRSIAALPGVAQAAKATCLTMQVRQGARDVRAMVVGFEPGYLTAGRPVARAHYEAIPLKDAQEAQFLKDNDAILAERARTAANPALAGPGVPGLLQGLDAAQTSSRVVNAVLVRVADGADAHALAAEIRRWKHLQAYTRDEMEEILVARLIATSARQIAMFLVILAIVARRSWPSSSTR